MTIKIWMWILEPLHYGLICFGCGLVIGYITGKPPKEVE